MGAPMPEYRLCPASGMRLRRYAGPGEKVVCPTCGKTLTLTPNGYLRRHQLTKGRTDIVPLGYKAK